MASFGQWKSIFKSIIERGWIDLSETFEKLRFHRVSAKNQPPKNRSVNQRGPYFGRKLGST